METASSSDLAVGFPLVFGVLAVLASLGLAVFGFSGDQLAAAWSFAGAMVAGTLAVAAYHVYG